VAKSFGTIITGKRAQIAIAIVGGTNRLEIVVYKIMLRVEQAEVLFVCIPTCDILGVH